MLWGREMKTLQFNINAVMKSALLGALLSVIPIFVLSFFPDLGSIPLPTGILAGSLDLGLFGQTPLPHAALVGAMAGVVVSLLSFLNTHERN